MSLYDTVNLTNKNEKLSQVFVRPFCFLGLINVNVHWFNCTLVYFARVFLKFGPNVSFVLYFGTNVFLVSFKSSFMYGVSCIQDTLGLMRGFLVNRNMVFSERSFLFFRKHQGVPNVPGIKFHRNIGLGLGLISVFLNGLLPADS